MADITANTLCTSATNAKDLRPVLTRWLGRIRRAFGSARPRRQDPLPHGLSARLVRDVLADAPAGVTGELKGGRTPIELFWMR